MGQEILYCYKCQTRLLGSEFEKGKAFKVGGQASCKDCVKELLASVPGSAVDKLPSNTRITAAASESGSGKWKAATARALAPPSPAPVKSTNGPLIDGIVAIVVVL